MVQLYMHNTGYSCSGMTSGVGRKETTATAILKTRGAWASGRLHFLYPTA